MRIALLLLTTQLTLSAFALDNKVDGTVTSTDSTELNIITVKPDEFPDISIILEAIKNGKPIFGLSAENVSVLEDGVVCDIVCLKEISSNYPINISLILDHSGSMDQDYSQLIDVTTGMYVSGIEYHIDSLGYFIIDNYPSDYVRPIDDAKEAILSFIEDFASEKDSIQIIGFSTRVDHVSEFSTDNEYLKKIYQEHKG